MKSFDEWYIEAKKTNDCGFTAKDFFEAGQQSKQAEIDALKNKMQTALNKACMLQNSSGERIYTELKELLK